MRNQNAEQFFNDSISNLNELTKVNKKLNEMFEEDAKVVSKSSAVE
jgi:hypothetical protein